MTLSPDKSGTRTGGPPIPTSIRRAGVLSRLSPAQFATLDCLCSYADWNSYKNARPADGTIARHTGFKVRAIRRARAALESAGLILVTERGGVRGKPTIYQIETDAKRIRLEPRERHHSAGIESGIDLSESGKAAPRRAESGRAVHKKRHTRTPNPTNYLTNNPSTYPSTPTPTETETDTAAQQPDQSAGRGCRVDSGKSRNRTADTTLALRTLGVKKAETIAREHSWLTPPVVAEIARRVDADGDAADRAALIVHRVREADGTSKVDELRQVAERRQRLNGAVQEFQRLRCTLGETQAVDRLYEEVGADAYRMQAAQNAMSPAQQNRFIAAIASIRQAAGSD